jgi:hypothetical protein
LLDWIYGVERFLQYREIQDFAERMKIVIMLIDRNIHLWWTTHAQLKEQQGLPIMEWKQFIEALRANYLTSSDEDVAQEQLLALHQSEQESMEAYCARAQTIYSRINTKRVPPAFAGEMLFRGIDRKRFPFTFREVSAKVHETRAIRDGVGLDFDHMRGQLVHVASTEPSEAFKRGPSVHGPARRINNVELGEQDHEVAVSEPAQRMVLVNQVDLDTVECHKCGTFGHFARTCTSTVEKRTCLNCDRKGHLARDCTSARKPNATGPSSSSAFRTRGARGRRGGGKRSESKNE